MVFADVYLQPDAPDPVLDEQVIVGAARRHVPDVGKLLEVDESGGEARAYLLEGDVVVKTQRPHRLRPRTSLAKEALVLAELHRHADVRVPHPLGHGTVAGTEYLCLTRVPGASMRSARLGADDRRQALLELGRTLRAIHAVDQSTLERSELLPGDRSAADVRARVAGTFERLGAAIEAEPQLASVADVGELAADCLGTLPEQAVPVSLHSNPGPEHTFVDPGTGSFTGLIDFGDAFRSHPAFDLRPWPGDPDRGAVLEGYRSAGPLPPGFEEVARTVDVIAALTGALRGRATPEQLAGSLDALRR